MSLLICELEFRHRLCLIWGEAFECVFGEEKVEFSRIYTKKDCKEISLQSL